MKYALLIYSDESGWDAISEQEQREIYEKYAAFSQEAIERGMMRGGDELNSASTATTVRVRDGETLLTDGPFAETKEQLGGFYLLECADVDQAIEMAAKIPGAASGAIEVRPVIEREGAAPAE
jgi:hypothetical protein